MPRYSDKQIADALEKSSGMVYVAAGMLECSPNTIVNRLQKSPRLQEVKDHAENMLLDIAESKLRERVEAGDMGAIKFILATKGRSRGYTERREVSGEDGKPVLIRVVYDAEINRDEPPQIEGER